MPFRSQCKYSMAGWVYIYVDDLLITSSSLASISAVKSTLRTGFWWTIWGCYTILSGLRSLNLILGSPWHSPKMLRIFSHILRWLIASLLWLHSSMMSNSRLPVRHLWWTAPVIDSWLRVSFTSPTHGLTSQTLWVLLFSLCKNTMSCTGR